MLFCRPLYYDSMFSGQNSIYDFRPKIAQQTYHEKNIDITKYFDTLNPAKLFQLYYEPAFKKVPYTEYIIESDFKTISELRTFGSFSLRLLKNKSAHNLFHAEFVYYWSNQILINYNVAEVLCDNLPPLKQVKKLKVHIVLTSTEEIIKKLYRDRMVSKRFSSKAYQLQHNDDVNNQTSTYGLSHLSTSTFQVRNIYVALIEARV